MDFVIWYLRRWEEEVISIGVKRGIILINWPIWSLKTFCAYNFFLRPLLLNSRQSLSDYSYITQRTNWCITLELVAVVPVSKSFTLRHCNRILLKDRLDYSKTWQGQYFNVLGHFFSVYCMWKIFISTVNIVFDRVGKVDPVTRSIEIAVKYMGFQLDVRHFFHSSVSSFLDE